MFFADVSPDLDFDLWLDVDYFGHFFMFFTHATFSSLLCLFNIVFSVFVFFYMSLTACPILWISMTLSVAQIARKLAPALCTRSLHSVLW